MLLLATVNKLVITKRIFKDKTSNVNRNIGSLESDEKGISGLALIAK